MESVYRLATQLQLKQWAVWEQRNTGAVRGYPTHAAFAGMMPRTGSPLFITDSAAERVDKAVGILQRRCPDQAELIKETYINRRRSTEIARLIFKGAISEREVRKRIEAAELAIEWIIECME